MKQFVLSVMSILVCMAMVLAFVPDISVSAVDALDVIPQLHYGEYDTLSMIYNQGDCYSMQGMTLDANYTYCAKIGDNDAIATIIRTSKTTGNKTVMTNGDNGSSYFYNLGHANALDMTYANGYNQMLVTAGATLVRLKMSGSTLYTAGTYTATYNGSTASMTAVQVMSASDDEIKVLIKTGRTLYTGTIDPNVSSGNIEMKMLCTLNLSSARLKGQVYDFSSYVQQGFDFHDNKVFLPLSGNSLVNTSIVLVYDLEGAVGDIKNDPTLSFRIISNAYSALFEIEDVAICQETGKLYFNTNRRVTDSDTNYDACSYFLDYAYNPALSTIAPADYRWETVDNELVSVTQGGGTYSLPTMVHGSISNNVMDQAIYSLSRSVMLKHNSPWVVEWKSSGSFSGGALLMAAGKHSKVPNAPFLFRYKESNLVALGYYTGSQHNNYGLRLSDYGIDGTAEHTYRLTNKIASDGSNMVYLSVDGRELGAMNNYYIGIDAQGTTSDWVNGQDFTFSYIGSYNHPITDCKLDYLQVWADGKEQDVADTFRWNTTGDKLTAVTGSGYTANYATIYNGSVSGTTFSNGAFRLDQSVVLMHNRPWSVEWEAEGSISGGAFLLSSAEGSSTQNAPFLFRYGDQGFIAFGSYSGSRHNNYGLILSDYGIDCTARHVYRLTNRVASDGSNMVYVYVDNVEIGPMNKAYSGLNSLGTTSNWLSGKDLVFDYVGNIGYSLNGTYHYLQVQETANSALVEFRNYNGTLLSSQYYPYGQYPTVPADPVRSDDARYTYTFTGWSPEVTAVTGDAYYIATYSSALRYYTVTFKNDDGTVLSTQNLPYGEIPTAPTNPTKPSANGMTYTFAGWDREIGKVTADAVYTATYTGTASYCTITFVNDDGTVLSTQKVDYGVTPTAPAAPTKASTVSHSYSFVGWDSAIVPANGDMTYTARYVSSLRKYTVTFKNYDGTVLTTQLTPYGYAPTAPSATPTRNADRSYHYTFSGWSPAVGTITGDTVYTAAYTTVAHTFKTATVTPSCSVSGKKTYTCSACGYSYSQTLAATGHSYVDGVCTTCGAKDPDYTLTQPTIKLKYPTLVFEDVIMMNVYFSATDIQNVVEMGLITYKTSQSEYSIETAEAVIPGYTWSEADGFYYATTKGIAAKDLGDEIYFSVYAKLSDGSYTYTRMVSYSPRKYAYAQLATGGAEMKPLVVAMLNYGAAAQTYFKYNTNALVNADLTADQKALVESYRSDMIAAVTTPSTTKQGIFVKNGGHVRRYPTISFEGAFCINYYYTPSYQPVGDITMYYWNQVDFNAASVLTKANATAAIKMEGSGVGQYHAAVEGIAAKDLDQGVYVAFTYSDGTTTYYSGVLAYSIGAYCGTQANATDGTAPLAQATAVYGYYAQQLFYKK